MDGPMQIMRIRVGPVWNVALVNEALLCTNKLNIGKIVVSSLQQKFETSWKLIIIFNDEKHSFSEFLVLQEVFWTWKFIRTAFHNEDIHRPILFKFS